MKKNDKKNSVFKNIGIVMKAWIQRYHWAWLLILIYLAAQLCNPFLNTLLSSKAIGAIAAGNPVKFLQTVAILLVSISLCSAIMNLSGSILSGQRIYTRLGVFGGLIFNKAIYTDYQNIELQKNVKIMGKAANSISGNTKGPEELMTQTINILVTILGIGTYGAVILMIDWKILLVILGMFAGNVLLTANAIKYYDNHREESSEIWRKKNYVKQKSLNVTAGKDIRIFQLKDWFHDLLIDVVKRRRAYERKGEMRWYLPTFSDVAFNILRDVLAYAILIKRVLCGEIDVATFTLYLGLISSFSNWIYSLANNFNSLKRASHELNDFYDFVDLPERKNVSVDKETDAESKASVTTNLSNAPEIVFKNVGFTYDGTEKATLKNLNFTIKAGEKIALVGNNGAGKTTVVKLLTGLYASTEGDILVNGIPVNQIPLEQYQDNISVLFQDTNPIAFSLEENVSSQEPNLTDKAKVTEALQKAGLFDKVNSLEHKEKTYITQNLDDNGILLSGGETQKLLLAKAIYKNGNFLILDEPTSALDPIAESKIYEEYNEMAGGKTAVFISHRLASTKFCDKIMFLDNGQIAEYGTHEELMALGGKYKEMFDLQSQYYN